MKCAKAAGLFLHNDLQPLKRCFINESFEAKICWKTAFKAIFWLLLIGGQNATATRTHPSLKPAEQTHPRVQIHQACGELNDGDSVKRSSAPHWNILSQENTLQDNWLPSVSHFSFSVIKHNLFIRGKSLHNSTSLDIKLSDFRNPDLKIASADTLNPKLDLNSFHLLASTVNGSKLCFIPCKDHRSHQPLQ